jgi:hypothetical protein
MARNFCISEVGALLFDYVRARLSDRPFLLSPVSDRALSSAKIMTEQMTKNDRSKRHVVINHLRCVGLNTKGGQHDTALRIILHYASYHTAINNVF